MSGFPLIRKKLSNEHMMAGLTLVLLFYLFPRWVANPQTIAVSAIIVATALLLDASINFIRFKMLTCAVSAAVTSLVLDIMTPDVPMWIKLSGIVFALVFGKHIWGGTGKNTLNPALTGVLFIYLVFHFGSTDMISFEPTLLLLPAFLLSIPFMSFRPYAAVGLMAGLMLGFLLKQNLTVESVIGSGMIFWSAIIITDPVTVTPRPYWGLGLGLLSGLISFGILGDSIFLVSALLIVNLVSSVVDKQWSVAKAHNAHFAIKRVVDYDENATQFMDLTKNMKLSESDRTLPDDGSIQSAEMIVEKIKQNKVFGYGGAAFPTWEKIASVMHSNKKEKHFIINAAECDPGLIHDKWLLRNKYSEIQKGIEVISRCIDFKTIHIGVKDNSCMNLFHNVKLHVLPDYYPIGAEKKLICQVLGKKLSHEEIPSNEGILVLNVQTVYAIYEAVVKNKIADTRFLTLANLKKGQSLVIKARLESTVQGIVEAVFTDHGPVFTGGGMMNCHSSFDTELVGENINFIAIAEMPRYKESSQCSKCGRCEKNCPEGLKVNRIADIVDNREYDKAKKYKPERCIGCNICSYVCPAGRKLSNRCAQMKALTPTLTPTLTLPLQ